MRHARAHFLVKERVLCTSRQAQYIANLKEKSVQPSHTSGAILYHLHCRLASAHCQPLTAAHPPALPCSVHQASESRLVCAGSHRCRSPSAAQTAGGRTGARLIQRLQPLQAHTFRSHIAVASNRPWLAEMRSQNLRCCRSSEHAPYRPDRTGRALALSCTSTCRSQWGHDTSHSAFGPDRARTAAAGGAEAG